MLSRNCFQWFGLLPLLAACGASGDPAPSASNNASQEEGASAAPATDAAERDARASPRLDATIEPATAPSTEPMPPTEPTALLDWLRDGYYLEWSAESAVHEGAGPHFGAVRTYVSAELLASLGAGEASHAVDSAAVKELYGGGNEVRGWAVMRKRQANSDGGEGWFWYEYYDDRVVASGQGVGLCSGCHSGGADYVLTPFPLQ